MSATTVTLLNASYEPLGKVSFQQAVRMVARKVAAVEEAVEGRMAGPWPWPLRLRPPCRTRRRRAGPTGCRRPRTRRRSHR